MRSGERYGNGENTVISWNVLVVLKLGGDIVTEVDVGSAIWGLGLLQKEFGLKSG